MSRRRDSATRRWQVSWRRGTDPGVGRWWGAGYAAARKDLDNDHAAAAARARRAIIGRGVRIGCVVRGRRVDLRYCGGHQLFGARDIGFAGGSGEQSVVTDAMEPLWQNVQQEAPDELVWHERHRAKPRPAV